MHLFQGKGKEMGQRPSNHMDPFTSGIHFAGSYC